MKHTEHPAYKIFVEYFKRTPDVDDEEWVLFKENYDEGVEMGKRFIKNHNL
jgi:hypothetical protein